MAFGRATVAKGAKSGKGKSGGKVGAVQKPWLKNAAPAAGRSAVAGKAASARPQVGRASTPPWVRNAQKAALARDTPQKGAGKGGKSSITSGRFVKSARKEDNPKSAVAARVSKDKAVGKISKGLGKGKKGKGKKGPAPANSVFWKKKMEEENRVEADDVTYTGTIASYFPKGGWGFIDPDEHEALPEDVRAAIEEGVERAKAAGRDVRGETHIYFRKPDIAKGFHCKPGKACTFQVYTDDKGAGAFEIKGVDGGDDE